MDLEGLRTRWLDERPRYDELAQHVVAVLEQETRRRGVICSVSGRAKAVDSLLKKALRKGYADPWEEIRDKAGARIVTTYASSLPAVEAIIRERFVELAYEDKAQVAGVDRFGYQGIHFEVGVREPSDYSGMPCEIQLHTKAQSMWADVSHQLSYKPHGEARPEIARSINRLVALMELFDKEVGESREAVMTTPDYEEASILAQLERCFYVFTARPFDRDLSLEIIGRLKVLYEPQEVQEFGPLLDRFVTANEGRLQHIFREYATDQRCSPLLFQPESLLAFERLEQDPFRLEERWNQVMPSELLRSLANVWGIAL